MLRREINFIQLLHPKSGKSAFDESGIFGFCKISEIRLVDMDFSTAFIQKTPHEVFV